MVIELLEKKLHHNEICLYLFQYSNISIYKFTEITRNNQIRHNFFCQQNPSYSHLPVIWNHSYLLKIPVHL